MNRRLLVLLVAAGCTPAAPPKPTPVEIAPSAALAPPPPPVETPPMEEPSSSVDDEGPEPPDARSCEPARAPKPLADVACVDEAHLEGDRTMGFSHDGKWLGYCVSVCDPCPPDCTFVDAGGHKKRVSFYYAPSDPDYAAGRISEEVAQKRREAKDAAAQKFLDEAGIATVTNQRVLHGPWKYPDLAVATQTRENKARGTTIVEVGARADGGDPVWVFRFELGPHGMFNSRPPKGTPAEEWRDQFRMGAGVAAAIDVTPTGNEIGVVAYASGPMWFETADASRMSMDAFAAKVYEESARAANKNGDKARAADLQAKAKKARGK
jgi:hypothetical protein